MKKKILMEDKLPLRDGGFIKANLTPFSLLTDEVDLSPEFYSIMIGTEGNGEVSFLIHSQSWDRSRERSPEDFEHNVQIEVDLNSKKWTISPNICLIENKDEIYIEEREIKDGLTYEIALLDLVKENLSITVKT